MAPFPSPSGHKYQSMVVLCETEPTIVDVDAEDSEVVYIPEDPIVRVVQESKARGSVRTVLGIALPITQRQSPSY